MKRCTISCSRENNSGILHRSCFFEFLDRSHYLRLLLPNCNINAFHPLPFLIDNRINCNCSFSCLAISNNELTLPSPNRNKRINHFDSCLKRNRYRFAHHYPWGNALNKLIGISCNFSFSIKRSSKWVNYTPNNLISHRNRENFLCSFRTISFFNPVFFSEENNPNEIFLKIKCNANCPIFKFNHL